MRKVAAVIGPLFIVLGAVSAVLGIVQNWGSNDLFVSVLIVVLVILLVAAAWPVKWAVKSLRRFVGRVRAQATSKRITTFGEGVVSGWATNTRTDDSLGGVWIMMFHPIGDGTPIVHRVVAFADGQQLWEQPTAEDRPLGSIFDDDLALPDRVMITWRDSERWKSAFFEGMPADQRERKWMAR